MWKDIPTICILSAEDDFRVPAIREAVEFWNAEFSQLGSPFRLGATSHSLRTISADDLLAYRTTPRIVTPSLLNSIREANGDVIIALSDEARFQSIHIPLASPPESPGRNPKLSEIFAAVARPRTQCCCPRTGACHWIGPQRRCNIVDVRRRLVPLRFSQCRLFSAHNRGESKVARNVSAELAAGAVPTVEGGSTGRCSGVTGLRSANGKGSHGLNRSKVPNEQHAGGVIMSRWTANIAIAAVITVVLTGQAPTRNP